MKIASFVLVAGLIFSNASNLIAQSSQAEQSAASLESVADRILNLSTKLESTQASSKAYVAKLEQRLDQDQKSYASLRKDLRRIKELLNSADGEGNITMKKGSTIPVEKLNVLAKSTLDKLAKADAETSNSLAMASELRDLQLEHSESHFAAIQTAKDFKAAMDLYRLKLPRALALLEFTNQKLKSQLSFVRQLESTAPRIRDGTDTEKPNSNHNDHESSNQIRQLSVELKSMADEMEHQGHHKQAKKLRLKANAISNSLSK